MLGPYELNRIYTGDARGILASMPADSVDALITDPPYPGLKGGTVHLSGGVARHFVQSETVGERWELPLEDWLLEAWRVTRLGMMVFCSYHFVDAIPVMLPAAERVGLAAWYKRNSPNPVNNVPHFTTEYIWYLKKRPGLIWRNLETMYDIPMPSAGCMGTERIRKEGDSSALHPTQKPVKLMDRLLMATKPGMIVCDPFCGTGTTLVAAIKNQCHFIGIDLDEQYCRIARGRTAAELLQPRLLTVTPQIIEQQGILI